MTVVRAELAPKFYFGDDAVLLAMDRAGVEAVRKAVTQAQEQGSSQLDHAGIIHEFIIDAGAADIDLRDDRAVWRLDSDTANEIIEKLTALETPGPGHHYVDLSAPAPTLVLSCDEYA